MSLSDYEKFKDLDYDKFKNLAKNPLLNNYEKVGFPEKYRKGLSGIIYLDIKNKLTNLDGDNKIVLEIGPGCSDLPLLLIHECKVKNHKLILIDSKEMLDLLPTAENIKKIFARFPEGCEKFLEEYKGKIDVILIYSVIQYVYKQMNLYHFIDQTLSLLSESGQALIGDIPNISKRKRFLSSSRGAQYHQEYTGKMEKPTVIFNKLEQGEIDDSVLGSIFHRYRNAGFDVYLMPQDPTLPMSNRREDLLIVRP